MTQPTVRLAQTADLPALQDIERAAASRFAESDLPPGLRGQTLAAAELQDSLNHGLLWVAGGQGGVMGFLAACVEACGLHILELSVLPGRGRQGLGTRLLDAATCEARTRLLARITLTTFSHVAWNGPAYTRAGFQTIADANLTPELARRLASERAHGLTNRIAMQRDVA